MVADVCLKAAYEESPGSKGQGCRITPGEGDFKDSATEIYRHAEVGDEREDVYMKGLNNLSHLISHLPPFVW